jgi:WD40 repeat protein
MLQIKCRSSRWRAQALPLTPTWIYGIGFSRRTGKPGAGSRISSGALNPSSAASVRCLNRCPLCRPRARRLLPAGRAIDFQDWRDRVIAYTPSHLHESLPGLISRQSLALPLRPDIINLRFSPDGKYVLAQDDGGIHVLSRDPFAVLFFIEAPDAHKAFFSPDSKSVVFYSHSLRVELWDIATLKRAAAHEILLNQSCMQSILSPDGLLVGCLKPDFSLSLLEVNTGATLITKQHFFAIRNYFAWVLLFELLANPNAVFIHMDFFPDGHV